MKSVIHFPNLETLRRAEWLTSVILQRPGQEDWELEASLGSTVNSSQ